MRFTKKLICLFLILSLANVSSILKASPFTNKKIGLQTKAKSAFEFIKKSAINAGNKIFKQEKWAKLKSVTERKIDIPGHENKKFVCQGVAYLKTESSKYVVLSYFPKTEYTERASQIILIDLESNKPIARFSLYLEDGEKYIGHAGGIAFAGEYLWVASGYKLRAFSKAKILNFINSDISSVSLTEISPKSFKLPAKKLYASNIFPVDAKASFVSFDGKYLWVGDFVNSSKKEFEGIKHHSMNPWKKNAWIAGYLVDQDGYPTSSEKIEFKVNDKVMTAFKPDKVIVCRESVQGMAVVENHIALTTSYGATNSKLAIYKSPLDQPSEQLTFSIESGEMTIEAYVVNDKNWKETFSLPAGAEDLEFDGEYLYIPFEGGSPNYKMKWRMLNPLIKIENKIYLISNDKLFKTN